MKKFVVLALGVALAAAFLIPASGTAMTKKAPPTYVGKECGKPRVEPGMIVLACADYGIYLKIKKWKSWGADKAKGKGKILVNDCMPDCASGMFMKYPMKVTLQRVRTKTCSDRRVNLFERAVIQFTGTIPSGFSQGEKFKLTCMKQKMS